MHQSSLANPSRRAFFLREPAAVHAVPVLSLSAQCFALRGVHCESCRDSCEAGALHFVAQLGGPARPVFDTARCNACAECARLCPANAICVTRQELVHG